MSDDAVFRALADSSRRELLDRLRERDGRTSQDLCRGLAMSRQAVAKHLSILEEAGLVSTRWKGREKLHFLNTAPIADAAEGWMARFQRPLPPLKTLDQRPDEDDGKETAPKAPVADGGAVRPVLRPLRALRRSEEAEDEPDSRHDARRRSPAPSTASVRASVRLDLRALAKRTEADDV